MTAPLTMRLPELVARVKAHFAPLIARVNFPGDYSRMDNIKVVDAHEIQRQVYDQDTTPDVDEMLGQILFGVRRGVLLEISDPDPDPTEEDRFYWELVARFDIPADLDVEEWLSVPEGRRAWGEWTTWHDHTRIATIWPPAP